MLTTRDMHTRECYVVAEEGADRGAIENAIKTMPNYFIDYDTTVHFISEEELKKNHGGLATEASYSAAEGQEPIRKTATSWNTG